MTVHNSVYYVPLDANGVPTSSAPLKARYNDVLRLWVDDSNEFVIETLGLLKEGDHAAFSSPDYDDVADYLDEIADAWLVDNS